MATGTLLKADIMHKEMAKLLKLRSTPCHDQ